MNSYFPNRLISCLLSFALVVGFDARAIAGPLVLRNTPHAYLRTPFNHEAIPAGPLSAQWRWTPNRSARFKVAALLIALVSPGLSAQITSTGTEEVRGFVADVFRDSNNMRSEIDQMFDQGIIGNDVGVSRDEVHQAMQRFVEFVPRADLYTTEDRGAFYIAPQGNALFVNPRFWPAVKKNPLASFGHEATHLLPDQVVLLRQQDEANAWITERYGKITAENMDVARHDPEFRKAAWRILSGTLKAERQSNYLHIAMQTVIASLSGRSLTQHLLAQAAPLNNNDAITTETFLDTANEQTVPEGFLLATDWAWAKRFRPGIISEDFDFRVARVYILLDSNLRSLLLVYINDPSIMDLLNSEFKAPSPEKQAALARWFRSEFLRESPPETVLITGKQVFVLIAAFALVMGGVALRFARRSTRTPRRSRMRSLLLPLLVTGSLAETASVAFAQTIVPIVASQNQPSVRLQQPQMDLAFARNRDGIHLHTAFTLARRYLPGYSELLNDSEVRVDVTRVTGMPSFFQAYAAENPIATRYYEGYRALAGQEIAESFTIPRFKPGDYRFDMVVTMEHARSLPNALQSVFHEAGRQLILYRAREDVAKGIMPLVPEEEEAEAARLALSAMVLASYDLELNRGYREAAMPMRPNGQAYRQEARLLAFWSEGKRREPENSPPNSGLNWKVVAGLALLGGAGLGWRLVRRWSYRADMILLPASAAALSLGAGLAEAATDSFSTSESGHSMGTVASLLLLVVPVMMTFGDRKKDSVKPDRVPEPTFDELLEQSMDLLPRRFLPERIRREIEARQSGVAADSEKPLILIPTVPQAGDPAPRPEVSPLLLGLRVAIRNKVWRGLDSETAEAWLAQFLKGDSEALRAEVLKFLRGFKDDFDGDVEGVVSRVFGVLEQNRRSRLIRTAA